MDNLAEIKELKYNFTKGLIERFKNNMSFMNNPYAYKCGVCNVEIEFREDNFESCLSSGLYNAEK